MDKIEFIPAKHTESSELAIDHSDKPLAPYELDQRYIDEYIRNPKAGKTAALRAAGHPNASRARAWQIHDRLADKIDKQLDKRIQCGAVIGFDTLEHLCKYAQSESVRAAAAVKLVEFADKAKPKLQDKTPQNIEDIDKEIDILMQRIRDRQNIPDTPQ